MANDLQWAVDHFSLYAAQYREYVDYYFGRHRNVLDDRDDVKARVARLCRRLRDNLCRRVVHALADRLIITGFSADTDQENEYLSNLWKRLRLETLVASVHRRAVRDGDAYVIVWPDETGNARLYAQDSWSIAVRYADGYNNVPIEAVKAWNTYAVDNTTPIFRLTRYLPDRVERYWLEGWMDNASLDTGALQPFTGDGESVVANPFGRVPVFRFANSLEINVFAQSELADVIPLQDLLNKTALDLAVAAEYQGFQQRWVTGVDLPVDPETGRVIQPVEAAASKIWWFANENVRLGEFSTADLGQLITMMDNIRLEIARASDTPTHLLLLQTGSFPSGEALKTAEAPLLSKIKNRQSVWGDAWEDAISFVSLVDGVNIDPASITVNWSDTTPHSDSEQISNASMKVASLGLSKRQALRELGYTDSSIDRIFDERRIESSDAVDMALRAFNAGPGNDGE